MSRHTHLIRNFLVLAAVVELTTALDALLFGGFRFSVGPLRISAGDPFRPFVLGVLCASAGVFLHDRRSAGAAWQWIGSRSELLALAAVGATLALGVAYGVTAAGAADPYGYVSQAYLWRRGDLFVKEPLAALDPIVARAAVPLGYRIAGPGTSVPIYSPGLPIMMALASMVGGDRAIYLVAPLWGAFAVWLTYRLGRLVAGPRTGLVAGVLFATSPIFLLQLFFPMSDLVGAACWLMAVVIALTSFRGSALCAGLACSLAIMVRPNLAPLAVAVAGFIFARTRRFRDVVLLAAGSIPGVVLIAVVNSMLYGSWRSSGYGSLGTLFSWQWIPVNLRRFSSWLLSLHKWVPLLAPAALFITTRSSRAGDDDRGVRSRELALLLAGYSLLAIACYVAYIPFDGWPFLRFWLPAIPVLFVLSSAMLVWAIGRLPIAARATCLVACCLLIGGWYLSTAYRLGTFFVGREERRYETIGTFLRNTLPDNAVVLAGLHSGSLRLYGNLQTLRWDQLVPGELDHVVSVLVKNGHTPYLIMEGDEESQFRNQFTSSSPLGQLDWRPIYEYAGHQHARVYSLQNQPRLDPGRPPQPIPEQF